MLARLEVAFQELEAGIREKPAAPHSCACALTSHPCSPGGGGARPSHLGAPASELKLAPANLSVTVEIQRGIVMPGVAA